MNAQIAATGAPNYKKTIIGVGETLKTLVQKTIKKRIGPPNELATLKRKKGNLPLIDTEQMINSIDYGVSKI